MLLTLQFDETRPGGHRLFRLDGDPEVHTQDRIAAKLAQRPKPLRCTATSNDDVLTISCANAEPDDYEYARIQRNLQDGTGVWGTLARRYGDRSDPVLLLVSPSMSIALSGIELRSWLRDYQLETLMSAALFAPTEIERAHGYEARINVGRSVSL